MPLVLAGSFAEFQILAVRKKWNHRDYRYLDNANMLIGLGEDTKVIVTDGAFYNPLYNDIIRSIKCRGMEILEYE